MVFQKNTNIFEENETFFHFFVLLTKTAFYVTERGFLG